MSKFKKPPCFNAVRAMQMIADLKAEVSELKAENKRISQHNQRLLEENTNLKIRCRIAEEDNKTNG